MRRRPSISSIVFAALLVATFVLPADAGRASRTRPSAASGAARGATPAAGTATYGHRGFSHRYHRSSSYALYGPYYGAWWYYGWPAWAWWAPPPPPPGRAGDRSAPGALETDVRPSRAEVRVDGAAVGQARDFNGRWDLLLLEPGDHEVEFAKPGYLTLRRHVQVRADGFERISVRLEKGDGIDPRSTEPPVVTETRLTSGFVRFDVRPADAAVYLDGEFLARADELARLHGALAVVGGRHVIEVVRPGYAARRSEVDVPAGETPLLVEITLDER